MTKWESRWSITPRELACLASRPLHPRPLVAFKGMNRLLSPRQHPPYGSNEPLHPTPSPSSSAIPWTDIPDTGNSLVFPRGVSPLRNLAKSVNLIRKASLNLTIFLINKGLTWNASHIVCAILADRNTWNIYSFAATKRRNVGNILETILECKI